jgi:MFS family permease
MIAGFLARWRVALLAGLVLGLVFGLIEGFSIFSLAVADSLDVERGQASGMFSAYLLASTVSAPLAGRLIDRFGTRRIVLAAFPVFSAGIAACSQAQELWQLYVVYVGPIAITTTLLIMSSQVMVNNGYPADRGTAVGISYACLGLGDFALFTLLGTIVERAGWRTAYVTAAVIAALGGAAFLVLTRTSTSQAAPSVAADPGPVAVRTGAPFGRAAFWFMFAAAFAASVLDFVIFQHLVPFLITAGYTTAAASFLLALASLGYVAGQLTTGVISDRIGREPAAVVAAALFAGGLVTLWTLPSTWLIGTAATVLGFSIGAVIGCRSAAVGDLFAGPVLGRVTGVIQVASATGAALATWIGGYTYDRTGSYHVTFGVATGCALVWAVALWLAAPRRAQHAAPHPAERV